MDSTAELAIITFLGDTEPWRMKLWCGAIEQLDTPMDTYIVVVDNTVDGVGELHLPQPHVVTRYEHRLPTSGPALYDHFNHLWRLGMDRVKDADYVIMLDSDIMPSVSYATLKSNLLHLPGAGVAMLKTRARQGNRHNLSCYALNSVEPFSYGPECFEPSTAVEVGRAAPCCSLFKAEALACYTPRLLRDEKFGVVVQENAMYHDLWANEWSVWLLGQLPWCRHYLDATHYVQDTPEVVEDTDAE